MTYSVERKAWVPYSPAQMYELVNKVDAYPQFVPWCVEGCVLHTTPTEMTARLGFSGKGMRKTFTTHNYLNENTSIKLVLVSGPFKQLNGEWTFVPLPGEERGCEVKFVLSFELHHGWMNRFLGRFFMDLANQLVDVFCQRADSVYGS